MFLKFSLSGPPQISSVDLFLLFPPYQLQIPLQSCAWWSLVVSSTGAFYSFPVPLLCSWLGSLHALVYKFLLYLIFSWKSKGSWVDKEAEALTFPVPLEWWLLSCTGALDVALEFFRSWTGKQNECFYHFPFTQLIKCWHSQHCTVWAVLQHVVCLAISKIVIIPKTELITEATLRAMILVLSPWKTTAKV